LPFESKSRETKKKVALRSRAIFLAASLLGVFVLPAVPMDSAAADTAATNGATTNAASAGSANAARAAANASDKAAHEADAPDKPPGDAVGTIEGDAIALQGPMSVEVVHGQVKTMLRSGNDIRVKSGQARIAFAYALHRAGSSETNRHRRRRSRCSDRIRRSRRDVRPRW
jgi:hypothetical protein